MKKRKAIHTSILLLLVALLAFTLAPVSAFAAAPIQLAGLKVTIMGKTYTPAATISGNNIVYTVDGTAGITGMGHDHGGELYLSFRTQRNGAPVTIVYEPYISAPNENVDDGNWLPTPAFPNGYQLSELAYSFDKASDPSYYLYKFRFYAGTPKNPNLSDFTDYTIRLKKNPNDSEIVLRNVSFGFNGTLFPAILSKQGSTTVITVDGTTKSKVKQFGNVQTLHFISNVDMLSKSGVRTSTGSFAGNQGAGINVDRLGMSSMADEGDYYVYTFRLYDYNSLKLDATDGKPSYATSTPFKLKLKKYVRDDTPIFPNTLFAGEDNFFSPWSFKQLYRGNFKAAAGKDYRECVLAENVTLPLTIRIRSVAYYKNNAFIDGVPSAGSVDFLYTFTEKKPYIDLSFERGTATDDDYNHYVTGKWRISVTGKAQNSTSVADATIAAIADRQYTGRQIKPAASVKLGGKTLKAGTDYTVKYGANKYIGKGALTITGKGSYTGTKKVMFKIVPKKTAILKVSVGAKQAKVTWRKVSSAQEVSKYEVRYRVKGTSKWTTKPVSPRLAAYTAKKLKKGKVYQFQVRSYKAVGGAKYYSPWSTLKTGRKIK